MENTDFILVRQFILTTADQFNNLIGSGAINAIEQYLKYDEYEMAFEILFTELMKMNKKLKIDLKGSYEIGVLLDMNQNSVYDENFWRKFVEFTINSANPEN